MASKIYRPRALLQLLVPIPGSSEPVEMELDVIRARHVRNDHNHADTLSVTVDWVDTGVDPRWITSATCAFYMGNADDFGRWEPDESNLRFLGRLVEPERSGHGDSLEVNLDFHDYTSFFLLTKKLASKADPLYSDTLDAAWRRICSEVKGAEELGDVIELRGLADFPLIGSAVAPRFAKSNTPVHRKTDQDAWAVWQQCCGMMGLISYFERDTLVVTTARDLYSADDPPQIVWGENILDFSERRNNDRAAKGVIVTSFDPLTGKTLESTYNPLEGSVKTIKLGAKSKRSKKPKIVDVLNEYEAFEYFGITEQSKLDDLARRVYEERSRQELEGSVTTKDMTARTASGAEFDLLSLGSGDAIESRILGHADAETVRKFDSKQDRINYLISKGYREKVAEIIASNAQAMSSKAALVHVKSVTTTLESGGGDGGGSFSIEIAYCNKIDPEGGTTKPS